MRYAGIASLPLIASLAACGDVGKRTEDAFNKSFDKEFRTSCIGSAARVPPSISEPFCDCALAEVNRKFSTSEKMNLSDDQVTLIMDECFNKVVQK